MSDDVPPVRFEWDGEVLRPLNAFWARKADQFYVVGEQLTMVPMEERSSKSERHYYAAVREAWKNLPEDKAEAFPTPDALRKHSLIKAKYCHVQSYACNSRAEAVRLAGFLRQHRDDHAVVIVREAVVMRLVAMSQSRRAMGNKDFQASKQAVLEIVAEMCGISAEMLSSNADKAA